MVMISIVVNIADAVNSMPLHHAIFRYRYWLLLSCLPLNEMPDRWMVVRLIQI